LAPVTESLVVYIFFFDLVGFTDQYCANPRDALKRLRNFQRTCGALDTRSRGR